MSSSRARVAVMFSLLVVAASAVGGIGTAVADAGTGDSIDAQEDVALEVTVVDRAGDPVGNADLTARWDGGSINRTTASNGKAFVSVPEGAEVTITIDHPNYVRNVPYVVENATEGEVVIEAALRGQATVVVENETGRVDDAVVSLFKDGNRVANGRTDADGRLATGQIERGEYRVVAFKEGYLRNETTLRVDGQVSQTMAITQDSVLVTFSVSDDHFDPPRSVANANVSIQGEIDVTTQGTGSVTVSIPVNDEYEVSVDKSGYQSVTQTLVVGESQTSLNATIRRTPELNARTLNEQIVINGTAQLEVTDEYGDRVPNATVTRNGEEVGLTDANGVIQVPINTTDEHVLRAEKNGLETSTTIDGVLPADESTPTPTPVPTATPTPTPTPSPTPTPTDTAVPTTATSDGGPGFGLGLALVAILALASLATRRRR